MPEEIALAEADPGRPRQVPEIRPRLRQTCDAVIHLLDSPFSRQLRVGGADVGRVTTAGVSPRLGPVALAYVHRNHFAAGTAVEGARSLGFPPCDACATAERAEAGRARGGALRSFGRAARVRLRACLSVCAAVNRASIRATAWA